MLSEALVALLEGLVRLYFPRRALRGEEHLPEEGPVLYVLNHPNALLDPVVLRVALGQPVRFLAKSTLFGNPVGRFVMESFGAIPVYRRQDAAQGESADVARNERTFALCRKALSKGQRLALFPEGTSHSRPQLDPLKTGAARIAFSAEVENDWTLGLTLVPVGLDYEDGDVFRTGVVLEVGEPVKLRPLRKEYERDPQAAVEALTEQLREALGKVVLQAETRELLDGVAAVAVWTSEGPHARDDLALRHARAAELLRAYRILKLRDPARVDAVLAAARGYASTLQELGVEDPWALEVGTVTLGAALKVVARLLMRLPLATAGFLLGWAPYRLAGVLARRLARGDEDMLGTLKLLAGLVLLPSAWLLEALVAGWLWGLRGALLTVVLGVWGGYVALRFDERLQSALLALRHVRRRERDPALAARLGAQRQALAEAVTEALAQADAE